MACGASEHLTTVTTGSDNAAGSAKSANILSVSFLLSPCLIPTTVWSRGQALRRRFVEHCSWERSAPTVKDPNSDTGHEMFAARRLPLLSIQGTETALIKGVPTAIAGTAVAQTASPEPRASVLVDPHVSVRGSLASATACTPSISCRALRRQSAEIRTGCTNEGPSGSVRGVSRTAISLPGSDRAASSERRRRLLCDRSVNGRIWLVCAFDVDCRYFGSHCPEIRRELPTMVHRVANRDVKVGDCRIVAQVEI